MSTPLDNWRWVPVEATAARARAAQARRSTPMNEVPMPEPVSIIGHGPVATFTSVQPALKLKPHGHIRCIAEDDALAYAAAREAAALERERAKTEQWRHVANEWADMATNGMQWVRNIEEGISTPADALSNLTECLAHCRRVNDAAPREAAAREAAAVRDDPLRIRALEELAQLGYTVRDDLLYPPADGLPTPAGARTVWPVWTCFHCGETFTEAAAARTHFGAREDAQPGCMERVRLGAERGLLESLRAAEDECQRAWAAVHEETTDAHRAVYAMQSRHAKALQNAEEAGYERGLADAAREAAAVERVRGVLRTVTAELARICPGHWALAAARAELGDGNV